MRSGDESAHSAALPYLLAATVLAGAVATGRNAPPLMWALWTVLSVVVVVGARRRRVAPLGGGYRYRAVAAVGQLGSDVPELRCNAVRELAAIADEWPAGRQVCIDALCTYLRRPQMGTVAERRVRATVLAVIAEHLRPDARQSWRGCDLNLAGASILDGSLAGAEFAGCVVDFSGARFHGDAALFGGARFLDARVDFTRARFEAEVVDFAGCEFSGGSVDFSHARQFGGRMDFSYARFDRASLSFNGARLRGVVDLFGATVERSHLSFAGAQLADDGLRCVGLLLKGGTVRFPPAFCTPAPARAAGP